MKLYLSSALVFLGSTTRLIAAYDKFGYGGGAGYGSWDKIMKMKVTSISMGVVQHTTVEKWADNTAVRAIRIAQTGQ